MRLQRAGRARVIGQVGFIAEPLDCVADAVDVFLLLLLRVGVVEAQVAYAAVFFRQLEVEPDALGVADVQVAIGFGWKARTHPGRVLHALRMVLRIAGVATPFSRRIDASLEVVFDDVA